MNMNKKQRSRALARLDRFIAAVALLWLVTSLVLLFSHRVVSPQAVEPRATMHRAVALYVSQAPPVSLIR
jgi:preprotein translocase subunit SecG